MYRSRRLLACLLAAAGRREKVYAPSCGFCRGDKARGASGPNLVRSEVVLNVVTGDAKAGESYFNGTGGCKNCHSTGDLAKIGARYAPDQLQTRFIWPGGGGFGGRGGGSPQKVTVTLASGETISGTLKRQDDFDISMYDAQGNYHSWPRDSVKVQIEDNLAGHRELLAKYTDQDMHNLAAYLVTLK